MKTKQILSTLLVVCLMTMAYQSHAQLKKAALISVYGNKNLSDDPMNTMLYKKILDDPAYDIGALVTKFDDVMNNTFITKFPFEFVPRADVVGAEGYSDLAEMSSLHNGIWKNVTIAGKDYVKIAAWGTMKDKEAIAKSFELLPDDVEGVMIAFMDFSLVDAGGVGPYARKKVVAYVNVKIFNKEGKRIFKLRERETSDHGVSAVGGIVVDPKKVLPIIEEATSNLFSAMEKKLDKSLAKMVKKMEKEMGG